MPDIYARLSALAKLLADTFPDGHPDVSLEADEGLAIRNGRYVLRLSDEMPQHVAGWTVADVAQVLLITGYQDDLRQHGCLEVRQDMSLRPCG